MSEPVLIGDQNVRRFDVAMDDPTLVGVLDAPAGLNEERKSIA